MRSIPTRTHSVQISAHGGPEQLHYQDVPLPPAGPTDVLVEVHTAAVSGWDVKYRRGLPKSMHLPGRAFFPLPQQLGREAAGTVVWTGPEVSTLSVGDRVVAATHPEDPYSRAAARGLGNLSPGVDLPGHQAPGGYAQHLVRDERLWFPLPAHVDLEQAAVTIWSFSTAHRILIARMNVGIGETLLVLGAAGAMGVAAVQMGRLRGAQVIAACRGNGRAAALTALGAAHVIDVTQPASGTAQLRQLAQSDGIDHVVDFTGDHDLLAAVLPALRPGASLCITAGEGNPAALPVRAADMVRLELNLLGVRGARRHDALVALDLLDRGAITVPVAARFPLSRVRDAHQAFESGSAGFGRIVLDPSR